MTKKEISNDVFDALPIEVRESKLTINQKKILNVLFNYSTLDKSLENGSFFISNEQLLKEAELEYPTQLQRVLSFLITNKFIERIAGTRSLKNNSSSASTYTINTKELIEYCEQHPQKTTKKGNVSMGNVSMGNVSMGNVSMGNGVKNVTDVTVIDELRKEIELLKVRINKLEMGNSNGNGNKITNVTTDIDTDIDNNINKLINITSGPVDKEIDILTNTTSGPFEINFNKIDKITYTPVVDDTNNEELRNNQIEKINIDTMNRENEMNERTRMIEMNDNEHTIENDNDNTPTLEDVLRQQSEEQNKLLNEVYQHRHNNYNPEKQQQYQRVFQKSNEAIEKWKQTHSDYIKAEIESYIKVVELLKRDGDISTKQYQAFDKYITSNFNKLYQGHLAFVRNVKYSSTGNINNNSSATATAQNANKAVLSPQNCSDIQTIIEDDKTQQEANKAAKMAIVEKECNARRKQFSLDTMEMVVNTLNFFVESKEERKEWINRYFDGINHQIPSYIEAMKKKALQALKVA